ncbi:Lactose transport system permease protein LacF [Paenibacillus konkukensis]|uniref:Lactose transport system permease protein LacF n=1 Tax=Paenibacillus konkukensis TaxID=2020716 RepID=A0ABY4RIQ3_9BACL|nr:sugar ABC transporter permease [Paenibacillus konkukensis]UQZ81307.1 Lactose transport system permease protein LacF [Paenibacillus konkukensis]
MSAQTTVLARQAARSAAVRRERARYKWAYLFILPQLLFFMIFTIYPIIMSYVYAFYDWSGFGPLSNFVGWDNLTKLLHDDQFWNAFGNSLIYMGAKTVILMPTTLIMALILNQAFFKGKVFYRTIYFLPVVTTTSIVGIIMKFIFGNDKALINELLIALGILSEPVPWLGQSYTAMAVLILVGSWKFFGMMMVYWLAGLQSLPGDVYEAAKVDGADYWQTLRSITIPLLMPVATVILLLTVVNSMHVFDLVKTLTNGGPFFATETVDLFIYNYAFSTSGFPQIGYASAAGIVFGLAIFIITLALGWLAKLSKDGQDARSTKHAKGGTPV